ncbi:MAG: D-glycero-beta-D-manno-heptose 1-phosphate adenylyltransferase [Anaerolineae bacterium]
MGKVISLTEAKRIRQKLRYQGKAVVFTNGVFDLLHVGHVRCLQAARSLGHALFVGLNSDASARRLKGRGRPLTAQAERAEVLCALACVDYVIFFDEDTAEHLILALQPDIYVKGGDYTVEDIGTGKSGKVLPEARVVENYGGRVVILPYTPGHSTSQLIARILDSDSTAR